jgi:uncharacterized membrane protein
LSFVSISVFLSIFLLHNSYQSNALDLGLFSQSLKYTLEGEILYHTIGGLSHLAYHFSPILLLLVPVYWIFPHVETLLVAQSVILGFSGLLVYLLCRLHNLNHKTGLAIEFLFFINPLVWGLIFFDFHEIVFAVPSILLLFIGIKVHKWWLIIFGLTLALLTKEDVIIILAVFGISLTLYNLWKKKIDIVYPVIAMASFLAYGIAVGTSVIFSEGGFPRILTYGTVRFEYLQLPAFEAIKGAWSTLFNSESWFLFCAFLAPLGFLSLLSWKWSFPGVIVLLSNMLSTCPNQHSGLYQSATPAVPFLFMGFVCSISWLKDKPQIQKYVVEFRGRLFTYIFILLSLLSLFFVSKFFFEDDGTKVLKIPGSHELAIAKILETIPDGVTVTANNAIFPHICDRTDTYLPKFLDPYTPIINGEWGYPDKNTQYVVIDEQIKQYYLNGYWEDYIQGRIFDDYYLVVKMDNVSLFENKAQ